MLLVSNETAITVYEKRKENSTKLFKKDYRLQNKNLINNKK